MKRLVGIASSLILLTGGLQAAEKPALENFHSRHMVAEAMLTAHFVAAALKAGMERDEINAVLTLVAERSAVTEFWVSDEKGRVVFTNVKGIDFTFPTDPEAGTQAAPFAALLDGSRTVVKQESRPREADRKVFKYVGVAGVDRPRIVQVGISAEEFGKR
ncbi:MAG: hypothetical protein OXI64_07200 [Defluviicoccus sp.]|nr:hypothetical protein [Defluviicoccus sp.]